MKCIVFIGLVLILAFSLENNYSIFAKPNDDTAIFTYISFVKTKIYEGEDATLIFSIKNTNSSETQFYIKINMKDHTIFDGKSTPFSCIKGETTAEMAVTVGGWSGPETHNITIELRSLSTDILYDLRELSLDVIRLIAGKLTSSPSKIGWGFNETLPLLVSFTNIGNDEMRDAVVTVMSSDLRISPLSSGNLGTLQNGETKTITFTISSLNKKETKPGPYKINLRISFNDFQSASHYQDWPVEFTIEKMKPKILFSYNPINPQYTDPINFTTQLLDEIKGPLIGETITFQTDSTIFKNVTSASGSTSFAYPSGLDSGNYSIRVNYSGSEYYTSLSEVFLVQVKPLTTSLLIYLPRNINATIPTTINATLLDERLRPVQNENIKLTIINPSYNYSQVEKTNNEGRAYITLDLNISGDAKLDISFSGSRNYFGSSNSSSININPASTKIIFQNSPGMIIFDNTVDLEILLSNLLNRPIENASLTIITDDMPITTVSTDSRGFAKTELIMQPTVFFKTTRIRVTFNGDEKAAQNIVEINITTINPAALVIVISILTGGVTSFLLLLVRWRKIPEKKIQPLKTKPVKPQKIDVPPARPLSTLDEKVYNYIVKHSGVISWAKASQELGISLGQLRASTQRLRDTGRLAQIGGE